MATDPGDLVLDPTCGSGTTAYVAEQWGRRWITIDTIRVALALARTRLMARAIPGICSPTAPKAAQGAGGVRQDRRSTRRPIRTIRQGFVYERVPHVTLKSIANNARSTSSGRRWQRVTTWNRFAQRELNAALGNGALGGMAEIAARGGRDAWSGSATRQRCTAQAWWEARVARQKEIDASIAKAADVELLYDRPYEDKSRVRVAGPFTVESLSPHRVVARRRGGTDRRRRCRRGRAPALAQGHAADRFRAIVIDYLRAAGVHQTDKRDKIDFKALTPWPGE